ncbi:MAG: hypothetical protein LBT52_00160 [Clostridiales Family XIII bacterium]|jgi:hypothetical protein|nr:hypothetical protein [Clostridiales Family XIII bacterium]
MTQASAHHIDRKRRRIRKLIAFLLSFFLALSILALSFLLLCSFTLLRPSFLLEQVDKSNYTEMVKDELEVTLISYGISSGFDEAFSKGLLNSDDMRGDIYLEVQKLYDPAVPGADLERFRAGIHEKLIAYVKAQGEDITPQMTEALDYLADLSTEAYQQKIAFPMGGMIASWIETIGNVSRYALIASIIFAAIVLVFLILIHPHKSRVVPYLIYAATAAGLFFGVVALAVVYSGKVERVGITNKGLYQLVTTYVTGVLHPMVWIAACMVGVSAIVALLYLYIHRKKTGDYYRV